MNDLISRQMAINALGEEPEVWTNDDEYSKGMLAQWKYDKRAIESLSSLEHNDWLSKNKDKILQAGMEGREVDLRIGGRLFRIREVAQ